MGRLLRLVVAASSLSASAAWAVAGIAPVADGPLASDPVRDARVSQLLRESGAKALGDVNRDLVYTPLPPCRLVDTRGFGAPIQGGAFFPNARRTMTPAGACGIPGSNVAALMTSFTTQNLTPTSGGYITFLSPGTAVSTTSDIFNLNSEWSGSVTIVQTQPAGQFDVAVNTATAQVVVDILGYFSPAAPIATSMIADGAVTSAKLAAPEPWHDVGTGVEPAFDAGWSSDSHAILGICSVWSTGCPVYAPVGFRKGLDGRVYLRGAGRLSLAGQASTIIFKLPATHAPANDVAVHPRSNFPCDVGLNIYGGGYVQINLACGLSTGPYFISLDGVSFSLD